MSQVFTTFYSSPLGILEIQSSVDAINAVIFLDEGRNPAARLNTSEQIPEVLRECIDELALFFKGELQSFSVPVMQDGTDFQQSVWNELTKIPFGKTISYLELSKRIGDVKAIRAVGTSNGKNNIAIIVPCHRVIGSNGSLTGYAGGLWRKQWLLEHEMKVMHGVQTLF